MNTQAASPGCPDPETISAVFDGEYEPDETLNSHLGACPRCARRLADYALMRAALTRAVDSAPDDGFNARIAAFVRANAGVSPAPKKGDFTNSRTAWILRIAALVVLSVFFVYLLFDEARQNKTKPVPRDVAANAAPHVSAGTRPDAVMTAGPQHSGKRFVKASLVPDAPSPGQYRIDIDPALIPDEFSGMPADGRFAEGDGPVLQRIPLRDDPSEDGLEMLDLIRENLNTLDVPPGLAINVESRGNSVFTTIRLESRGRFDMSVKKTDDAIEFLMVGDDSGDDGGGLVSFQIEFFCE